VRRLPAHYPEYVLDWDVAHYWISSLCRILLRVQNYRHGGALLVTPDSSLAGLNIKHRITYSRLRSALEAHSLSQIEHGYSSDEIFDLYIEPEEDLIPVDLYFDESVSGAELNESGAELEGVIWFVSLLTRVDGLVVMNPKLEVKGFGVEITISGKRPSVYIASTRSASEGGLRRVDYNQYGTRHRSMMRYCNQVPGSVGFVVSQDGEVRVMTKVRRNVIIWENIKLQLHDFVRPRPKRKARPK
jgi:hypothetical protein